MRGVRTSDWCQKAGFSMPDHNCSLGPTIGFHRFDAALLMLACWRLELAPRGQASHHGAVARPPTWPGRAAPPSCIYRRPPVFFLCTLRSPPLPVFLFALLLLLISVVACLPPVVPPTPSSSSSSPTLCSRHSRYLPYARSIRPAGTPLLFYPSSLASGS